VGPVGLKEFLSGLHCKVLLSFFFTEILILFLPTLCSSECLPDLFSSMFSEGYVGTRCNLIDFNFLKIIFGNDIIEW